MLLKNKAEYYEEYQNGGLYPVAFLPITNYGGLGILECDDEEVVVGEFFAGIPAVIHKLKLYYSAKEDDYYFKLNNQRYFICEFCKTVFH